MNIRSIRSQKNISVPELVKASGVPRRTIQDIEKRDDCMVSTAIKLADALGVTLDELCGFDEITNNSMIPIVEGRRLDS